MLLSLFNATTASQKAAEPALHGEAVSPPRLAVAERPVVSLDDAGDPEGYRGDVSLALADHRDWLESGGREGARADLTGYSLCHLDLHGADLRYAFLRKADLSGADLSLADLRGACLIQSNLHKANLLSTRLQDAALQGAQLDGASNLAPEQLAGANLAGASLSAKLDGLLSGKIEAAQSVGHRTRQILAAMLLTCLGASLLVVAIRDDQLVANLPILRIPFLAGVLPADAFLLVGPFLLFCLFIGFHLQLMRLWSSLAELPAVFPDARPLDKKASWLMDALVRSQFQWPGDNRMSPSPLERAVFILPAYWTVPAVLLLFWGRYLTRLDLQGAVFQAGLVVAAVFLATFLPRRAAAEFPANIRPGDVTARRRFTWKAGSVAALGLLLGLLSFGTIHGQPYNADASDADGIGVRGWAPKALWMVGYHPYARFPEAEISAKLEGWPGGDADLQFVRGPRLDGVALRHAVAPGVFLANARLGEADLRLADLVESDLRGADLHKANLRSAVMDRARLATANLQGASLPAASLLGADLRAADLSYAILAGARLDRAELKNAVMFNATLRGASLFAANLESADLRDSNLEAANLNQAVLRRAYLWSARLAGARLREAQLQNAILIEADLQRAVLRGASFQGAVLRDAVLDGADVQGADFREAIGLTASQLCAAQNRSRALLDSDLAMQVAAVCPR